MKRKYYKILLLLIIMLIPSTIYAATTAYSGGSKYAVGTIAVGDDFKQNVINAANGYFPHSSLTASYYNTDSNYAYLNSSSRLGGSRIFFINGHANTTFITSASRNDINYKTGISTSSNNPYNLNVCDSNMNCANFKLVGIGNRNFSSTKIITFAGCYTALGINSLASIAVNKNAKAAVGFAAAVNTRETESVKWLKTYNYAIGAGQTLQNAINAAINNVYPNHLMSTSVRLFGQGNTTLSSSILTAQEKKIENSIPHNYEVLVTNPDIDADTFNYVRTSVDDLYQSVSKVKIKLQLNFSNIVEENLTNYTNEFINIISEIKKFENDFDPKDYKVSYHIFDDNNGFGRLNFVYYINGKIATNKSYTSYIENFDIARISITSVTKDNLINVDMLNEQGINKKLDYFEQNKDKVIMPIIGMNNIKYKSILNADKSINVNSLNANVYVQEKYRYDYNTNSLIYYLILSKSSLSNNRDLQFISEPEVYTIKL